MRFKSSELGVPALGALNVEPPVFGGHRLLHFQNFILGTPLLGLRQSRTMPKN